MRTPKRSSVLSLAEFFPAAPKGERTLVYTLESREGEHYRIEHFPDGILVLTSPDNPEQGTTYEARWADVLLCDHFKPGWQATATPGSPAEVPGREIVLPGGSRVRVARLAVSDLAVRPWIIEALGPDGTRTLFDLEGTDAEDEPLSALLTRASTVCLPMVPRYAQEALEAMEWRTAVIGTRRRNRL
jgi:hypothetical protein